MPFSSFSEGEIADNASEPIGKVEVPLPAIRPRRKESYLEFAVHTICDPAVEFATADGKISDEISDYAKGFAKALPLFMKGRFAFAGLLLSYAADEAKIGDSAKEQVLDTCLGAAKGAFLKGTFHMFGAQGATPGMSGVGIGFVSRVSDAALTRANYLDGDDSFSLSKGIETTLATGLDRRTLIMDAITFGASDILWARLMNGSRGAAFFRPEITHAISGGTMGLTTSFVNELQRQIADGGKIDTSTLLRRTALGGAFDSAAGGLGGMQTRRHSMLKPAYNDSPDIMQKARSTKFQLGEIADAQQIVLRDGAFVLDKKLTSLTTETWLGWTKAPDGRKIRSIFRPDNGTEAFAHRMQTEVAAYGLQTLGLKMAVPVTVARKIVIDGKTHSGYIQEMEGVSFAAFAKNEIGHGQSLSRKQLLDLLHKDKGLADSYSNAWLHRMVIGEWDNHALNMTVHRHQDSNNVRNIDLGDSLRPAATILDLIPTPGVRQGYDRINAHLYKSISGKNLSAETLSYLRDINSQFSTPQGRSRLFAIGLTPQQSDGLLGRIDWLVKNKKMPLNSEAMFYLPLNDARRAIERWVGKPENAAVRTFPDI